MKKLQTPALAIAFLLLSITTASSSFGQSSASASIGATIVTPMTISRESDLEFVQVSAKQFHKVQKGLCNDCSRLVAKRIIGGSFTISGIPDYAYDISMPKVIRIVANAKHLTIGTESCSQSGNGKLTREGKASISVEGTMFLSTSDVVAFNAEMPNSFPITINNN